MAEIGRAWIVIGCETDTDLYRGTTTRVLCLRPAPRDAIIINMYVFSLADLSQLFDALEARGIRIPYLGAMP